MAVCCLQGCNNMPILFYHGGVVRSDQTRERDFVFALYNSIFSITGVQEIFTHKI